MTEAQWREVWAERAAVYEYVQGLPRAEAEDLAHRDVARERAERAAKEAQQ